MLDTELLTGLQTERNLVCALWWVHSWWGRPWGLQQGEQVERSVLSCGWGGGESTEEVLVLPPREVRGGFSKAVTFELSPKEGQVLWDDMAVGEETVPRRGDTKNQILRPERA